MLTAVFVMMIWAGGHGGVHRGDPAVMLAFASLEDCERSRPAASGFYDSAMGGTETECVELTVRAW